ncbi:hypothetical protein AAVH_29115 [Aphelenchoides avenae]|nr:hypothetical protein AAVH_29115 [Aphelenchus avenae]
MFRIKYTATGNILERLLQTCGPWPIRSGLYRVYGADVHDHFYTTSYLERENATHNFGYTAEGTTGAINHQESYPCIPFYRLWHAGRSDHLYTTNENERDNAITRLGYADEGIAGHVFSVSDVEPGAPEYDHFYTVNATEKAFFVSTYGYFDEGIAACIFPRNERFPQLVN